MGSGRAREALDRLREVEAFLKRYVVGLDDLVRLLIVALLTGGHILIEGPTGTGKTVLARLFSRAIGGTFRRVQMTPDILPSDILGTYYFDARRGEWVFREGPVFANVLMVDELNRAPPRTQSALLEVMQERQVTIEGRTHRVPEPFLVVATQMVVGSEGTYPLTPVLADRFAYSARSRYPSPEAEVEIVRRADEIDEALVSGDFDPILGPAEVVELRRSLRDVYVSDRVARYAVDLVSTLRSYEEVRAGPSPRASIWIHRGARALALLEGMGYVVPDHVKYISRFVLPHRMTVKPELRADGVEPETLLERALRSVEVPKV